MRGPFTVVLVCVTCCVVVFGVRSILRNKQAAHGELDTPRLDPITTEQLIGMGFGPVAKGELEEILGGRLFVLHCGDRELAAMTVNTSGELVSLIVKNPKTGGSVTLSAGSDGFPGELKVGSEALEGFAMNAVEVVDWDLDGIADRKYDWKGMNCYIMENFEWSSPRTFGECKRSDKQ